MRLAVLSLALVVLLAGCGAEMTSSPTPSPSATQTATNAPTASPTSTSTPTPSPSPTPTSTATSTRTPTPTPKPTATPTPSPTPTPTATPTPTPAPNVEFDGRPDVTSRDASGEHNRWAFDGTVTNADTRVVTQTYHPRLWIDEPFCGEPNYELDDPSFTVTLNPGTSWSPPEKWRMTFRSSGSINGYTLLPEPYWPECEEGDDDM